jgi:repressor LexA
LERDAQVSGAEVTDRQREVLYFINMHRERYQCNPTCSELAQAFHWASPNAAQEHLKALERKGVIAFRDGQKSRGYVVVRGYMREGLTSP